MQQLVFSSERLYFRTAKPNMAREMLRFSLENADFFSPWEPERPTDYYTLGYNRMLVRYENRSLRAMRSIDFWLYDREQNDGRIIGKISAFGIIPGNYSSCIVSYKIAKCYSRRGYMREALTRFEQILSEYFSIHRIEAYILPENAASRALVKSCGFEEEGICKRSVKIGSEWRDHIRASKLTENKEEQS